jgi:3-deoxy-7-phosphoheptulonate synthase
MIILLKPDVSREDVNEILEQIASLKLKPLYMPGVERTVIGVIGDERKIALLHIENHPLVESVTPVLSPYKLVSREFYSQDTVVNIDNVSVGGDFFTVIAGPCAIESKAQLYKTAEIVKKYGGHCLRGGAFKPRTSPYSFQGLGTAGLKILADVSQKLKIPTVTEVIEVQDIKAVEKYASAFQVGARNMQNFRLLKAIGQSKKPVILKRGISATINELLLAAEYIVSEGNSSVILCERGIRTYETVTRNTLDLNAVPYIKQHCHLPIIVDPSHGTGIRELVEPMAKAAVACGADGIMVEVHCDPKNAMSDGKQSLFPEQFKQLLLNLKPFVEAAGKRIRLI